MALTKEQKKKIIEELKENILKQKAIIFVDFSGLKTRSLSNLRKELKTSESQLKVAKKTLTKIAFEKSGLKIGLENLKGELALVFCYKEAISPSKILWRFSQENPNLKILGGILEGEFTEGEKIIELAKLPERKELLRQLVNSVSAPISNFVNVLQGNIKGLIYVLAKVKA